VSMQNMIGCLVAYVAASKVATKVYCAKLLSSVLLLTCRYEVVSDAVYDTRDPAVQKLLFTGRLDACVRSDCLALYLLAVKPCPKSLLT
jgi:hypothetical protein